MREIRDRPLKRLNLLLMVLLGIGEFDPGVLELRAGAVDVGVGTVLDDLDMFLLLSALLCRTLFGGPNLITQLGAGSFQRLVLGHEAGAFFRMCLLFGLQTIDQPAQGFDFNRAAACRFLSASRAFLRGCQQGSLLGLARIEGVPALLEPFALGLDFLLAVRPGVLQRPAPQAGHGLANLVRNTGGG